MILHGEQETEVVKPLPRSGNFKGYGKVLNIYDKGKGALFEMEFSIKDAAYDSFESIQHSRVVVSFILATLLVCTCVVLEISVGIKDRLVLKRIFLRTALSTRRSRTRRMKTRPKFSV